MDKKWPFGFFVYSNVGEKEAVESAPAEAVEEAVEEVVEEAVEEVVAEAVEDEPVKVVWAEPPAAIVVDEDETPEEEILAESEVSEDAEPAEDADLDFDFDVDEFDEDADLPDLEEELEIALEEAHEKGLKKQRLVTGISAGVALLGAVGLATGLAIHNHFKKKQ